MSSLKVITTLGLLPSRLYCRFWNLTRSTAKQLADFHKG